MPAIRIAYNPELTLEKVKSIFARRFIPPYTMIDKPMLIGVDFAIGRSDWTGMAIRYKPISNREQIKLIFNAYTPSVAVRLLLNGLIPLLILMCTSWRRMTKEFREFITTCPDFRVIS